MSHTPACWSGTTRGQPTRRRPKFPARMPAIPVVIGPLTIRGHTAWSAERTAGLRPRLLLTLPHHHPEPQARKSNLLAREASAPVPCTHRAPVAHRCLTCPPTPSRQTTAHQPARVQACNPPPARMYTHTPIPTEDSMRYGTGYVPIYTCKCARARGSGKTNNSLPATRLTPTWLGYPLLWERAVLPRVMCVCVGTSPSRPESGQPH